MNFYCSFFGRIICFVRDLMLVAKQIHSGKRVNEKFTPSLPHPQPLPIGKKPMERGEKSRFLGEKGSLVKV